MIQNISLKYQFTQRKPSIKQLIELAGYIHL